LKARRLVVTGAALALAFTLAYACVASAADAMPGMSDPAMSKVMGMDDMAAVGKVMLDQVELEGGSGDIVAAWDGQAWYGGDYDKVWLKSEGSPDANHQDSARNELLWDHVLAPFWDLQAGVRYDVGQGPARGWAALGIEGLAAYWFDVEATLYVGEAGRTAARLRVEHDLLITQRLIAQPEVEADLYSKADAARDVTSGLSDLQLGLRVRYEIRRELAPYVGLAWRREVGRESLQWVAGLHAWL
jgi:copper resistance protein B